MSSLYTWTCTYNGESFPSNSNYKTILRFMNTSVKCKLELIVKFLNIFNKMYLLIWVIWPTFESSRLIPLSSKIFSSLLSFSLSAPGDVSPILFMVSEADISHSTQILGFDFSLFLSLRHDIFLLENYNISIHIKLIKIMHITIWVCEKIACWYQW